jgi:hypothetical protein
MPQSGPFIQAMELTKGFEALAIAIERRFC